MKTLIRYKIYCIICLLLFLKVSAQTPEINMEKYWFYRERFNNYFIAQTNDYGGAFTGCNIPAGIRHNESKSSTTLEPIG